MTSPYADLPPEAYWRTGVAECPPASMAGMYRKKWDIGPDDRVAAAGSCFAQHISRYLRKNDFRVMDVEPAPEGLPAAEHELHGYGQFSARYGNIYTAHQLLQLSREAAGIVQPADAVWEKDGRYYDALRPSVHPHGLPSADAVAADREQHLEKVREMFSELDLFIFTLGLTEAWVHATSGTVYPTAPETIAGRFEPSRYVLKNYRVHEIIQALDDFQTVVRGLRPASRREFRILLTVSPVPLTATASGNHVLAATTYSKSVLRAVAGQLTADHAHIDYFPSFEIITNQAARGQFYEENLRSVRPAGVEAVMRVFFSQHGREGSDGSNAADRPAAAKAARTPKGKSFSTFANRANLAFADDADPLCEDALLEAFSGDSTHAPGTATGRPLLVFIGDSHLASAKSCVERFFAAQSEIYDIRHVPVRWLEGTIQGTGNFTRMVPKRKYARYLSVPTPEEMRSGARICLVGMNMLGVGILRMHGRISKEQSGRAGRKGPAIPPIDAPHALLGNPDDLALLRALPEYGRLRRFYGKSFTFRKSIMQSLQESGIYERSYWIAAPNIVERGARFRLGDAYVDSCSQYFHNRIALRCFRHDRLDQNPDGWLITHPDENELPNGFSPDAFACGSNPLDIHTSPEFYRPAVQRLFDALAAERS